MRGLLLRKEGREGGKRREGREGCRRGKGGEMRGKGKEGREGSFRLNRADSVV